MSTIVAVAVAAIALAFGGYRVYQNTAEKAKAAALERLAQESAREKAAADRLAAEKAKAEEVEKIARDRANQQAEAEKIAADKAKLEAERLALERTQRQAEAERIAAEKAKAEAERIAQENARQQAEADRIAAEKAKAEADRLAAAKAKTAEMERIAFERAKQLRARWRAFKFPPPNGGLVVFTIMSDGNPACASYDAASCLWGLTYDQIDFKRLRPLVCGEAHRARWGVTGYEDPRHWCSLARRVRANPS